MLRKILFITLAVLLIWGEPLLYAVKVNLTKSGTSWVWRVENGLEDSYILTEAGNFLVAENGERLMNQTVVSDVVLTEAGNRLVHENGEGVLLESSTAQGAAGTMLYRALIGQGWEHTDLDATIPQAIIGTAAAEAYGLLALESGDRLLLENSNTLRLEN